ncbi:hypothetical protein GCM10009624_01310 [Gordonia sinesedis]
MNPTILRRIQITLLVVGGVITVMALALVVACLRDDASINANKGTVMADVVSADALHAAAYFQTPDGQIHSPRLGLLYPTELSERQRISVEYDTTNPDLARPAGRNASLSIIPALSVAVLGWAIVGALMLGMAELNRFWTRRAARRRADADTEPDDTRDDDALAAVR